MNGYIYKIINITNGKSYIGQTVRSVEQRFKEHFHPSSGCVFLHKAIKEFGKDNFIVTTLETINGDSKTEIIEKLDVLEIELINKNNTLYPNGYNGCLGGGNSADYLWKQGMSPESIAKRAEKHKKPIKCN